MGCPADCHEVLGKVWGMPAMLFISNDDGRTVGDRKLTEPEREAWHALCEMDHGARKCPNGKAEGKRFCLACCRLAAKGY